MSCIIKDYLFLGGVSEITDKFKSESNIKTIINVAVECNDIADSGITIFKFDIYDDFIDIHKYFNEIITIIKEGFKRGGVLVHCHAGVSRSATIVIAYLIKEMHMSLYSAYDFVNQRRPVKPNPHFMKQLMRFEEEILSTNSYEEYIDDYSVKYIMDCLHVRQNMFDIVKETYIKNDRDILKTVKQITQPIIIVGRNETSVII